MAGVEAACSGAGVERSGAGVRPSSVRRAGGEPAQGRARTASAGVIAQHGQAAALADVAGASAVSAAGDERGGSKCNGDNELRWRW